MNEQNWELGVVSLKVQDLAKMTEYYQKVMGMHVLKEGEGRTVLGVKDTGRELVELVQIIPASAKKLTAGLYHLAILLPSRSELGSFLYHLLLNKYDLMGASDHGYSEALYFNDPEGNGIEVYADKPKSMWDIREDGRIEGVTLQMDAEGVIGAIEKPFVGLPIGTVMGHVHLTVHDLESTERFYKDVMGLGLKSDFFGQAKFFAFGEYHHLIGSNTWGGKNLPHPEKDQLGMAHYTWLVSTEAEMQGLIARLDKAGIAHTQEGNALVFEDNSGIELRAVVATK